MTEGWEEMVGGDLEFIPDSDEMYARSLEHIDKKRAALKLPAYDPTQFGASGDSLYFAAIREYLARAHERGRDGGVAGLPARPRGTRTTTPRHGHTHDEGDA